MRATVKVKCFLFDGQVCPSQVLCRGLQLHSCTFETLGGHAQGQWCLGWDCLVHPGANPYVVAHRLGFAQGCAHPLSAHSEWKENRICVQDIRPIEERSLCPCTNSVSAACTTCCVCFLHALVLLAGTNRYGSKIACPWLHLEFSCFWGGHVLSHPPPPFPPGTALCILGQSHMWWPTGLALPRDVLTH